MITYTCLLFSYTYSKHTVTVYNYATFNGLFSTGSEMESNQNDVLTGLLTLRDVLIHFFKIVLRKMVEMEQPMTIPVKSKAVGERIRLGCSPSWDLAFFFDAVYMLTDPNFSMDIATRDAMASSDLRIQTRGS
jgi:hypothetical protein